jgi:hypothetical protein
MEFESQLIIAGYVLLVYVLAWTVGRWYEQSRKKPFMVESKRLHRPFFLHEAEGILKGSRKHYTIYYFSEIINWKRAKYELPEDEDVIESKTGLPMLKRQIGYEKP